MELPCEWAQLDADQLRALATKLMGELAERDVQISERDAALTARDTELARNLAELNRKQLKIDQLTYEMAILKRWQFAKRSEQLDAINTRSWMRASMRTSRPSALRSSHFDNPQRTPQGHPPPRGAAGRVPATGDPSRT